MYEYVKGLLHHIDEKIAIVDVHGIGYKIFIPSRGYTSTVALDKSVFFYVALIIREDHHSLFGFLTKEERNLFLKLSSLSGIGPKTALAVISYFDIQSFFQAIIQKNSLLLSKIPGIGKKTAERLILDMKDKIKDMPVQNGNPKISDALLALVNLGYDRSKAEKALYKVVDAQEALDTGQIIKEAMRKL